MLAKGEVESDCNQSSFVFQNRWQKQQCRYYRIIKHFGGFIFAVQVLQHLYNDALPDPSFFVYRHINSCASFNQMSLQPLDHHLWKFGQQSLLASVQLSWDNSSLKLPFKYLENRSQVGFNLRQRTKYSVVVLRLKFQRPTSSNQQSSRKYAKINLNHTIRTKLSQKPPTTPCPDKFQNFWTTQAQSGQNLAWRVQTKILFAGSRFPVVLPGILVQDKWTCSKFYPNGSIEDQQKVIPL